MRFVSFLLPPLALFWAGAVFGVAFLATPVKFLAPSLTMPAAIDVGRQTFQWLNRLDVACAAAVLVLLIKGPVRRAEVLLGLGAAAIVALETLWMLPVLDARAETVIAGGPAAPSALHHAYVTAEALKVILLAALGIVSMRSAARVRQ